MKEEISVTKSLKVVLCGSLKLLDEMEKLAKKLEGWVLNVSYQDFS